MGAEPPDIRELRIRAALLLKALRSAEPARASAARARLAAAGVRPRAEPQLKHALEVVAREAGAASWAALKRAPARFDFEAFFAPGGGAFLNRWFASYAEARASREAQGGFLFPFRSQFFVCEAGFLEARGVDPADPDWARLGFDWAHPADPAARDRLERKLLAAFPR